ncbi:MAG: M14 family metallopeptidase [Polyangiaceae bacterium]
MGEGTRKDDAPPPALVGQLERRGLGDYAGPDSVLERVSSYERRGALVTVAGRSVQGEPILSVEIGPAQAPVSLVVAGLHPMEWIGVESALACVEAWLEEPPAERRLVAVPMANPDGIRAVEANLRRGRRRFVRHNAHGVDLNRNFPAFWGSSPVARLLRRTFAPGRAPASEPEVRAIIDRVARDPVDRVVSLHSFGGAVLYPYGAVRARAHDFRRLARWAERVAESADTRRPYRAVQSSHWVAGFTARGMEIDYFYQHRGALALLVECSRGGVWRRVPRPSHVVEPFAWFNPPERAATSNAIAGALMPFLRGD